MDIEQFHESLAALTALIKQRGLNGDAHAYVNWLGDELRVVVEARENADANGRWSAERNFNGTPSEATDLIAQARAWIAALPSEEDRAIELIVRKLNEMAALLPKGHTDVTAAAWAEIYQILKSKADRIAKNGLPSPARVTNLDELRPRMGDGAA